MPKIKGTKNIKKSDPHQNYCLDITKNGDIEDLLLETYKMKYTHYKYFQTKISGVTLIDLFSDL